MDRTHRIGQHRPINVTRLIIENSIEARILDLQKKKENLAASTLGDDDKAMGRVSLPVSSLPVFLASQPPCAQLDTVRC
jgi:SNF2 family DNA or RNA helicase